MTATANAAPTSDRELVLTRIIDAPRHKVFKAWTDPKLLKQWFVPLPWHHAPRRTGCAAGPAPTSSSCATRKATICRTAASISKLSKTSGWGQCADQLATLVTKL
jgi:Activator of Hsp90 ATPase homolog 1-like protein